jgi:hypothetical protein
MAVTVALIIGLSHVQICWKAEKVIYTFGIQSFLSFHFELWPKVRIN